MKSISNQTIGIIGNGVVGNATAKSFQDFVADIRCWDVLPNRRNSTLADVLASDIIFICLPTPALPDGGCDTSAIDKFFNGIVGHHNANLVIKSTVPIGYTRKAREAHQLPNLVHSPEFLTARTAVEDACNPTRMLIGIPNWDGHCRWNDIADCRDLLLEMCRRRFPGVPTHYMSSDESEFVKLMQNAFSAIKIAAFNEFRQFSDAKGLDWGRCLAALLAGGWVNPMHTQVPGPDGLRGFGGACLPKDLDNLIKCIELVGLFSYMCEAAANRNTVEDRPSCELVR